MKTKTIIGGIAALLLLATSASAAPRGDYQSCIGTLVIDEYEIGNRIEHDLQLDMAASGVTTLGGRPQPSLWCDATIPEFLMAKVLKVCAVGDRCQIKGEFRGHGTFGWTRISSVKKLAATP
jgi:hypothetical protein